MLGPCWTFGGLCWRQPSLGSGKQLLEVFDFGCTIACVLASSHDILMHVGSEAAFAVCSGFSAPAK